jgi:hypothetical protein
MCEMWAIIYKFYFESKIYADAKRKNEIIKK